jgi:hypothetical protein
MPPQTRGAAKRARMADIRESALTVVLSSGFLHWFEAVKLGTTCKEMQLEWQDKKDHICEPLLASLNELIVSTNHCLRCSQVAFPTWQRQCGCTAEEQETPLAHLDPRLNENHYSQLSIWQKCKTIAEFTSTLVARSRSNSNRDDFDFIGTNNPGLQFLAQEMPRRFAFLISFNFAVGGHTTLYFRSGANIAMFNRFFLADENPTDPSHGLDAPLTARNLNFDVAYALNALMPWTNHMFKVIIDAVHDIMMAEATSGYRNAWEMLSPALARKLDFLAPFINDNGTVVFPEDIEPMSNEEEARIRGMMPPT